VRYAGPRKKRLDRSFPVRERREKEKSIPDKKEGVICYLCGQHPLYISKGEKKRKRKEVSYHRYESPYYLTWYQRKRRGKKKPTTDYSKIYIFQRRREKGKGGGDRIRRAVGSAPFGPREGKGKGVDI